MSSNAPYKRLSTVDARTKRRLRRSRTQRTSYSVKANDGKASEQSVQLFDSTSVTENSSKSNENFCFSQNNLSQDVTLSFPLELLSGTEFVHSQPNASSVAEDQKSCWQKEGGVLQIVPQLVDTGKSSIDDPSFNLQNAHLSRQVYSDLIIDATCLTNDISNPSSININAKGSSSKGEISTWVSEELNGADEIIVIDDDSEQTAVPNENGESGPECVNEQPEQAKNVNLPSPEFHRGTDQISSGNYQGENDISCNEEVTVVNLQKEAENQTVPSDDSGISETQYTGAQNGLNYVAPKRNQDIHSPSKKHYRQSSSFLSYKYSGRSALNFMSPNHKARNNKQTTLDAFLNRHVEGEVQTKMHQKEPDEKIDSVRNEIMRARQVYLNKCMETLVPNILTRTFVQKFSVNIFEEPAESVVNMDYSPTFHNLHFARSTTAELQEILNSSTSAAGVLDETLTKVVTEHCGSRNAQNSDSDSENEESKANRSWLKAYINETKHHRNDLMEKVEMECKDDNFGNNLRELFILQDDNSKDEELQELLTKFHDCLGLVE